LITNQTLHGILNHYSLTINCTITLRASPPTVFKEDHYDALISRLLASFILTDPSPRVTGLLELNSELSFFFACLPQIFYKHPARECY